MTDRQSEPVVLITGVSGFIGKHLAREFLQHGYRVRGTVRAVARAEGVRAALEGRADISALEFIEADLLSDSGWADAVAGVDHVVHCASPFPLSQPKKPADLVRPAVDGTMRVLNAAVAGGARTFVQTSSIAAITLGHGDRSEPYTQNDWADLGSDAATPYVLSKTLSERTARDFVDTQKPALSYMSVNPGFVLGPLLDAEAGTSAKVLAMMLEGKYPAVPRLQFPVVDVRDVATAHRLAIERGAPDGRYIAAAGSLWMREMAAILRQRLHGRAGKVPKRELPDFVVRLGALFDSSLRTIRNDVGLTVLVDASATERALAMTFISPEEAVVAMAESLYAFSQV